MLRYSLRKIFSTDYRIAGRDSNMPIITVKLAKGRSIEQKRQLARALSDASVQILDVNPEWVTIVIDEYDRENRASGRELHADKLGNLRGKDA
jgi:4-oxalocrotonate tautomerase